MLNLENLNFRKILILLSPKTSYNWSAWYWTCKGLILRTFWKIFKKHPIIDLLDLEMFKHYFSTCEQIIFKHLLGAIARKCEDMGEVHANITFHVMSEPKSTKQRWKNVQILQIYLCYFSLSVLIYWPYTRKVAKDTVLKAIVLKALCYMCNIVLLQTFI